MTLLCSSGILGFVLPYVSLIIGLVLSTLSAESEDVKCRYKSNIGP